MEDEGKAAHSWLTGLHGRAARWTVLAVCGAALLLVGVMACSDAEPFNGTPLRSANPAPPFELENQFGDPVKLSDHRGDVVLLTFLYTSCPDVCPITTGHIRDAHEMLGSSVDGVTFLAVSVDPERDTVEEALAYSAKWDMTSKWDFLVGDRERLAPIWRAYYIDPNMDTHSSDVQALAAQVLDTSSGGVEALGEEIAREYLVSHSSPVYLIDREGLMRVVLTLPFEPAALAHDLEMLLSE